MSEKTDPVAAQRDVPDPVLSVSELNRLARQTLEQRFPLLWVAGEISNLTRAPSGHLYFTLKDDAAQVRCTMWRNRAQMLPFQPIHGMRVEARALVSLYEARGDYQLNVETLRQAGLGSQFEAFNRLKQKLAAEGLFDAALKRDLPAFPRGVGIVTSPKAAALRDVLAAFARRAPHLPLLLYPAPVQGEAAPALLAEAVAQAGARAAADGIDVLLLVRGGGSLEDLAAFNDEALARAIRACPIPVVSGVGHETDFSIADFVADLRAATPTAAAELASAGYHAAAQDLDLLRTRLGRAAGRRLEGAAQRLDRAALRLVHPRQRLEQAAQQLALLHQRLGAALGRSGERRSTRLDTLAMRLHARRPEAGRLRQTVDQLLHRLQRAATSAHARRAQQLTALAGQLELLNPEAILGRGYSIARDQAGNILHRADQVEAGDAVSVQLGQGTLGTVVTSRRS
jgi:exodeoxyribonuclease VII large subunit